MTPFEQLCTRLGVAQNAAEAEVISAMVNASSFFSDKEYTDTEIIEAVAAGYVRWANRKERNQGYEIIAAETHATENSGRQHRIVLGRMETKYGAMFVTWESSDTGSGFDYFWGHYHDTEKAAWADYHRRLLSYYER